MRVRTTECSWYASEPGRLSPYRMTGGHSAPSYHFLMQKCTHKSAGTSPAGSPIQPLSSLATLGRQSVYRCTRKRRPSYLGPDLVPHSRHVLRTPPTATGPATPRNGRAASRTAPFSAKGRSGGTTTPPTTAPLPLQNSSDRTRVTSPVCTPGSAAAPRPPVRQPLGAAPRPCAA